MFKKITVNPFLKGYAISKLLFSWNSSNKGKAEITFGLDFSPLEKTVKGCMTDENYKIIII